MNDAIVILLVLLGGAGATFLFIGNIFTIFTTFGINRNWGIVSILVPLSSVVFCIIYRDRASYPLKLMAIGFLLTTVAVATWYGIGRFGLV